MPTEITITSVPSVSRPVPQRFCCRACCGEACHYFASKCGFALLRCRQCGTILAEPPEDCAAIDDLYGHYYDEARFAAVPVVRSSLEQLVRGCEVYRQTGCWLDVGFGEGALLDVAESLGWQCYGTEVAPQSLEYGRTRGWTVAECSEHDARFVWGGFDVVTMIELIEHVPEPERCLANACRLLRPGGLLYVTTPNAGSLNRRVLGAEWSVFAPPEHLTIWSAAGLRTALARNGLQVQSVRTEGLNPSELVSRLRRHGAQAASRNEAGFALNEKFSSSRWRRGLKSKINSGLCLFGIGDTLKVRATRLATAK